MLRKRREKVVAEITTTHLFSSCKDKEGFWIGKRP
jgi:hypothetical protein